MIHESVHANDLSIDSCTHDCLLLIQAWSSLAPHSGLHRFFATTLRTPLGRRLILITENHVDEMDERNQVYPETSGCLS